MQNGKKILLGLGTVVAAALPISTVVSCSEKTITPEILNFNINVTGSEASIIVKGKKLDVAENKKLELCLVDSVKSNQMEIIASEIIGADQISEDFTTIDAKLNLSREIKPHEEILVKIEGIKTTTTATFVPESKILSILDNVEVFQDNMSISFSIHGDYLQLIDKNDIKVTSSILGDIEVASISIDSTAVNQRELKVVGKYNNSIPANVASIDIKVDYKNQAKVGSYKQAVIKSISSIKDEGELLKISVQGNNLSKITDKQVLKAQIIEGSDVQLSIESFDIVSDEQINLFVRRSTQIKAATSIIEIEYNTIKISKEFKQATFTSIDSITIENSNQVSILFIGENLDLFTNYMLNESTLITSNPEIQVGDLKLNIINPVRVEIRGTLSREMVENITKFTFTTNRGETISKDFVQATIDNIKDQKVLSRNKIQFTLVGKNLELLVKERLTLMQGETKFVVDEINIEGFDVTETTVSATISEGLINNELSSFNLNASYLSFENTITLKQSVIRTITDIQIDSISDEATITIEGENFDLLKRSGEIFNIEISPSSTTFKQTSYEIINETQIVLILQLNGDITSANTMFNITFNELLISKVYRQAVILEIENSEIISTNQIKFTIKGENLELFEKSKLLISWEQGSFILDEITIDGFELKKLIVTATTIGTISNKYSKFDASLTYKNKVFSVEFKQAVLSTISSIDIDSSNVVSIEIQGMNLDLMKDLSKLNVSLTNNEDIKLSEISVETIEEKTFIKAQLSEKITRPSEIFKVTYNGISKSFEFKQAVVTTVLSTAKLVDQKTFKIQLEGENLELLKNNLFKITYEDFEFEVLEFDRTQESLTSTTITVVSDKEFKKTLASIIVSFEYDGGQVSELEYKQSVIGEIVESSFVVNGSQITFNVKGNNFDLLEGSPEEIKSCFSLSISSLESTTQYANTIDSVKVLSSSELFITISLDKELNNSILVSLSFRGKTVRGVYEFESLEPAAQVSWFRRLFKK